MRLKASFERSVQADVGRAVEEHGNLTRAYFVPVRRLALRYWLEWSRHELFEWVPLTLPSSHPTTKS